MTAGKRPPILRPEVQSILDELTSEQNDYEANIYPKIEEAARSADTFESLDIPEQFKEQALTDYNKLTNIAEYGPLGSIVGNTYENIKQIPSVLKELAKAGLATWKNQLVGFDDPTEVDLGDIAPEMVKGLAGEAVKVDKRGLPRYIAENPDIILEGLVAAPLKAGIKKRITKIGNLDSELAMQRAIAELDQETGAIQAATKVPPTWGGLIKGEDKKLPRPVKKNTWDILQEEEVKDKPINDEDIKVPGKESETPPDMESMSDYTDAEIEGMLAASKKRGGGRRYTPEQIKRFREIDARRKAEREANRPATGEETTRSEEIRKRQEEESKRSWQQEEDERIRQEEEANRISPISDSEISKPPPHMPISQDTWDTFDPNLKRRIWRPEIERGISPQDRGPSPYDQPIIIEQDTNVPQSDTELKNLAASIEKDKFDKAKKVKGNPLSIEEAKKVTQKLKPEIEDIHPDIEEVLANIFHDENQFQTARESAFQSIMEQPQLDVEGGMHFASSGDGGRKSRSITEKMESLKTPVTIKKPELQVTPSSPYIAKEISKMDKIVGDASREVRDYIANNKVKGATGLQDVYFSTQKRPTTPKEAELYDLKAQRYIEREKSYALKKDELVEQYSHLPPGDRPIIRTGIGDGTIIIEDPHNDNFHIMANVDDYGTLKLSVKTKEFKPDGTLDTQSKMLDADHLIDQVMWFLGPEVKQVRGVWIEASEFSGPGAMATNTRMFNKAYNELLPILKDKAAAENMAARLTWTAEKMRAYGFTEPHIAVRKQRFDKLGNPDFRHIEVVFKKPGE